MTRTSHESPLGDLDSTAQADFSLESNISTTEATNFVIVPTYPVVPSKVYSIRFHADHQRGLTQLGSIIYQWSVVNV